MTPCSEQDVRAQKDIRIENILDVRKYDERDPGCVPKPFLELCDDHRCIWLLCEEEQLTRSIHKLILKTFSGLKVEFVKLSMCEPYANTKDLTAAGVQSEQQGQTLVVIVVGAGGCSDGWFDAAQNRLYPNLRTILEGKEWEGHKAFVVAPYTEEAEHRWNSMGSDKIHNNEYFPNSFRNVSYLAVTVDNNVGRRRRITVCCMISCVMVIGFIIALSRFRVSRIFK